MAKLTGPLMSLDASGSVASTLTFAKWKGRPYVRQLVTPSNPRSPGQTANRAMLNFLGKQWALLSAPEQATWQALADIGKYSTFNAFCSENLRRWTQFSPPSKEYPATELGLSLTWADASAVGGVRQATLSIEPTFASGEPIWGGIIYRDTAAIVTPTKDMVVGVLALTDGVTSTFVDTPLEPDTYHYRVSAFDGTGGSGNLIAADFTAVVT